MNRDTLLKLAERVEAAQGADRDLDRDVAPLSGIRVVSEGGPLGICYYDENGYGVPLPLVTRSIDAVMTLIPEGWFTSGLALDWQESIWRASLTEFPTSGQITAYANNSTIMLQSHSGIASTPALALLAACLRAIAEGEG